MTRHTPDFLRQRSSNLSLRAAAAGNASRTTESLNNVGRAEERPMTTSQKAWVLLGLDSQSEPPALCNRCAREIVSQGSVFIREIRPAAESSGSNLPACQACALSNPSPETFTEPFCNFLRDNPTIFHSVEYFKKKAAAIGYKEVCSP